MKTLYKHPQEDAQLAFLLQNDIFRALTAAYQQLHASVADFSEIRNRNFQVTKQNYPRLYSLLRQAAARLRCRETVSLYLEFSFDYSCRLLGSDGDAVILLSSKCLEDMDDLALLALLGRQMSHIQCRHVAYLGIDSMLEPLLQRIPIAGAAAAEVTKGLLLSWRRYAEMTADRGGAIASGSADHLTRAVMYQMGGSIRRYPAYFAEAARHFQPEELAAARLSDTIVQRVVRDMQAPFGVQRLSDLMRWCGSGQCREQFPQLYYNSSCSAALPEELDAGQLFQKAESCGERDERLFLLHGAARKGSTQAMVRLGQSYLKGTDGLPKDPDRGADYVLRAAKDGDADALYLLGQLFRAGVPGFFQKNEQLSNWMTRVAYGKKQAMAVRSVRERSVQVPVISKARLDKLRAQPDVPVPPEVREKLLRWLWIPMQDEIAAWEIAVDSALSPKAIAVCDTGIYFRDDSTLPYWIDWKTFFRGPFSVRVLSGSVVLLLNGRQLWRGGKNAPEALVHKLIRLAKAKNTERKDENRHE